jgi:hypothetical protein
MDMMSGKPGGGRPRRRPALTHAQAEFLVRMTEKLLETVLVNDDRDYTFALLVFTRDDGDDNANCAMLSPLPQDEMMELLHDLIHGNTH